MICELLYGTLASIHDMTLIYESCYGFQMKENNSRWLRDSRWWQPDDYRDHGNCMFCEEQDGERLGRFSKVDLCPSIALFGVEAGSTELQHDLMLAQSIRHYLMMLMLIWCVPWGREFVFTFITILGDPVWFQSSVYHLSPMYLICTWPSDYV